MLDAVHEIHVLYLICLLVELVQALQLRPSAVFCLLPHDLLFFLFDLVGDLLAVLHLDLAEFLVEKEGLANFFATLQRLFRFGFRELIVVVIRPPAEAIVVTLGVKLEIALALLHKLDLLGDVALDALAQTLDRLLLKGLLLLNQRAPASIVFSFATRVLRIRLILKAISINQIQTSFNDATEMASGQIIDQASQFSSLPLKALIFVQNFVDLFTLWWSTFDVLEGRYRTTVASVAVTFRIHTIII